MLLLELRGAGRDRNRSAQQIPIGISDDELAVSIEHVVLPVPSLLERDNEIASSRQHAGMQAIRVGDLDLKIHATTKGMLERRLAEAPARACHLLEHQIGPVEIEIGEPLLGP